MDVVQNTHCLQTVYCRQFVLNSLSVPSVLNTSEQVTNFAQLSPFKTCSFARTLADRTDGITSAARTRSSRRTNDPKCPEPPLRPLYIKQGAAARSRSPEGKGRLYGHKLVGDAWQPQARRTGAQETYRPGSIAGDPGSVGGLISRGNGQRSKS